MLEKASGGRLALAAICIVIVALPFLLVRYPPITDLPQQVAQIRLFGDAVRQPGETYVVQWFTPYSLSYVVLGLAWWCCPPLAAGRVAMLLLGVSWVVGVHALAAQRRRSAESAVLASLFFFCHMTYWGFYSFNVGWSVFILWFALLSRRRRPLHALTLIAIAGVALLLYMSHALWLAVGIGWLVLSDFAFRTPRLKRVGRLTAVLPVLLGALLWYGNFSSSQASESPQWDSPERLNLHWLAESAFGGLRGPIEGLLFAAVVAWLALSLANHRGNLGRLIDRELLLASGVFFLIGLVAPDRVMNTRDFSARWIPLAMACLVLSMPAPELTPVMRSACVCALAVALGSRTVVSWRMFENEELSGLDDALMALPDSPRILGLDYVQTSRFVKTRAFLQTFAYAQVLRGGTLNFSFAEAAASLVVFRRDRPKPSWTHWLEWRATSVEPRDFLFFDFVLINGYEETHRLFSMSATLLPVTREGRWRLYRVRR